MVYVHFILLLHLALAFGCDTRVPENEYNDIKRYNVNINTCQMLCCETALNSINYHEPKIQYVRVKFIAYVLLIVLFPDGIQQ